MYVGEEQDTYLTPAFAQMTIYSAQNVPLGSGERQNLFLGGLKNIFGGRDGETFRQLHLWLSNAWYFTKGTI